jgi:hypothetical protein
VKHINITSSNHNISTAVTLTILLIAIAIILLIKCCNLKKKKEKKDQNNDSLCSVEEKIEKKIEKKIEDKIEKKIEDKIEKKIEDKIEKKIEDKIDEKIAEKQVALEDMCYMNPALFNADFNIEFEREVQAFGDKLLKEVEDKEKKEKKKKKEKKEEKIEKKSRKKPLKQKNPLFSATSEIIVIRKNRNSRRLEKINITTEDIQAYKDGHYIPSVGIKNISPLGNTMFHNYPRLYGYKNKDQFLAFATLIKLAGEQDMLNHRNQEGDTPLHLIVADRYLGYESLIEKFIICEADVNIENKLGKTPLDIALENNNIEIAKILIDNYADLNKFSEARKLEILRIVEEGEEIQI